MLHNRHRTMMSCTDGNPVMIQYCPDIMRVYFLKANGEHTVKVFAVKDVSAGKESLVIEKKIPFKPITTRTLYLGTHHVELVVNGKARGKRAFELTE